MFNLIVRSRSWTGGRDLIPAERVFEYTEKTLAERYRPAGVIDIAALAQFPTLFVEETHGRGDQVARVGVLLKGSMVGRELALEYVYDASIPPIPNAHLQQFAAEIGIDEFQFSRTHWSVQSGDLFRSLLRNLQPRMTMPAVFKISDPESIDRTLLSTMMPFHPRFDAVYEMLKRTAENVGLQCRRADDLWENQTIIQDIVTLIDRSRVVVCDCTERNSNVFYETGIAHTLGREVILITQSIEDIPFDLRHLRYVHYLNNREGLAELSKRLQLRLEALGCAAKT